MVSVQFTKFSFVKGTFCKITFVKGRKICIIRDSEGYPVKIYLSKGRKTQNNRRNITSNKCIWRWTFQSESLKKLVNSYIFHKHMELTTNFFRKSYYKFCNVGIKGLRREEQNKFSKVQVGIEHGTSFVLLWWFSDLASVICRAFKFTFIFAQIDFLDLVRMASEKDRRRNSFDEY